MKNKSNRRKRISKDIFEALPEDLKSITDGYHGREKDIVLLSSIGVLSSCLPNVYGLYDGNDVYPNLYVIVVAPPASGKGVMGHSRKLIDPIHNKIQKKSRLDHEECVKEKRKNKEDDKDCPQFQVKISPANTSTSELYTYLGRSNHGLLIIETEADTMSSMFENGWSDYSPVLRKVFHHEPISISRKMEKIYEDIKEPKLSMVITGTPNQLEPLLKTKGNGLFSRFIIYSFDEMGEFKNVFDPEKREYKSQFDLLGQEILEMYGVLCKRKDCLEFKFTEEQQNNFYDKIKPLRDDIIENHSEGFISNLYRHGLICFRVAMVLSAIRNRNNLGKLSVLECDDVDYNLAIELTITLLSHSQYIYDSFSDYGLPILDYELLDALDNEFTSKDAYEVAKKLDMKKRTVDDKFKQWLKKRLIKRVSRGVYIKAKNQSIYYNFTKKN